ncbi:MAG: serine hydrolase domain-containing protein [Acidimicrobiales bacterium]
MTTANRPSRRDPLPASPSWPGDAWPTAPTSPVVGAVLERAFGSADGPWRDHRLDQTLATVVVQHGRIVAEAYGPATSTDTGTGTEATTTLISWSMAKSITHAWIGLLVGDGLLDLDEPAPVAAWADDERAAITLRHLLSMTDGLDFTEDYVDEGVSDVIEMLFGAGTDDVAGYAIARPAAHPPGTRFNYSSGTSNIVARIAGDAVLRAAGLGPDVSPEQRTEVCQVFLAERLFGPLGMTSATTRFDAAGTFVGSSYLYATARDFARFGALYLADGVWNGERLLPEGWVDQARTPVDVDVDEAFWYGSHWWLWDDATGAFGCHGYEGQYIVVHPALDAVVVRLGKTDVEQRPAVVGWIEHLFAALADPDQEARSTPTR